jgi:hypothetical protein
MLVLGDKEELEASGLLGIEPLSNLKNASGILNIIS